MTIYGYARVSTADQVKGGSLDEQERKIRALAEYRTEGGGELRIFRDEGISGSVAFASRPAGAALAAALRPGDTVIVSKLDRAFRDAADALSQAKAWKAAGVGLVLADMGPEPVTENGVGKMLFTMLAAMAEWERERIAERMAEGKRAKRAKGGHTGGAAPFGSRIVGSGKEARLEADPTLATAVAAMWRMIDAGMSYRAISTALKTSYGASVSYEAIRKTAKRGIRP